MKPNANKFINHIFIVLFPIVFVFLILFLYLFRNPEAAPGLIESAPLFLLSSIFFVMGFVGITINKGAGIEGIPKSGISGFIWSLSMASDNIRGRFFDSIYNSPPEPKPKFIPGKKGLAVNLRLLTIGIFIFALGVIDFLDHNKAVANNLKVSGRLLNHGLIFNPVAMSIIGFFIFLFSIFMIIIFFKRHKFTQSKNKIFAFFVSVFFFIGFSTVSFLSLYAEFCYLIDIGEIKEVKGEMVDRAHFSSKPRTPTEQFRSCSYSWLALEKFLIFRDNEGKYIYFAVQNDIFEKVKLNTQSIIKFHPNTSSLMEIKQ